jgi:hypothetical protein
MYIPLSNIKSTGYTNGYEFTYKNAQPYTGPYFIDINNNVYTGITYSNNSQPLQRIIPDDIPNNITQVQNGIYASLNPKAMPNTVIAPDYIIPTENDYNKGYFVRFLLKPIISSLPNDFVEVRFNKYNLVSQEPNLQLLYQFVNVIWKITGPWYDIYDGNIRTRAGIIDTNKRAIAEAEKTIPNVSLYFTDLRQFGSSL